MAKSQATDPLSMAMKEIEGKYSDETVQVGRSHIAVDSIPTGILSVDVAFGCGGLPRGRIVEIYGAESSGKTTFTLQCIAACQKAGGVAAFIDAEHALDPDWASKIGVDIDKLLINQPGSGEKAFHIAQALCKHEAVDLIVIDSVAALVPQSELDADMDTVQVGAQARMVSKGLRKLVGANKRACVLFINQLREKIGGFTPFAGSNESTPGGRALKHYATIRTEIKRIGSIKVGDDSIGNEVRLRTAKNKIAPPFKTIETRIFFGSPKQAKFAESPDPIAGFDVIGSILDGAVGVGALSLRGSNYYFGDKKVANGAANTQAKIRSDQILRQEIVDDSINRLKGLVKTPEQIPEIDFQDESQEGDDG